MAKSYRTEKGGDFDNLNTLVAKVDGKIDERKVPQPSHIHAIFEEDLTAVRIYYFMHALFHYIENNKPRGMGEPDYKRRDEEPLQSHSFGTALKADYRLRDKIPSNYRLNLRQKRGALIYDVPTKFGQNLEGALVVNDMNHYLFGPEVGGDADSQTKRSILSLSHLEEEIARNRPRLINQESVYKALKAVRDGVNVSSDSVRKDYWRVLDALRFFRAYVQEYVTYMPDLERRGLISIIDELLKRTSERRKEVVKSKEDVVRDSIAQQLVLQYNNMMRLIEEGKYVEIDDALIQTKKPRFFEIFEATLYDKEIQRIAQKVKDEASSSQNGDGEDYLTPMVITLADSTDHAAKLDPIIPHTVRLFNKSRNKILVGREVVEYLKERKRDYQQLQYSTIYLFRILDHSLDSLYNYRSRNQQIERSYERHLKPLEAMRKEMDNLEKIINSMESSFLSGLFRSVVGFKSFLA